MSIAQPAESVSEYRSPLSRLIAKQFLGKIAYVSLGSTVSESFKMSPTVAASTEVLFSFVTVSEQIGSGPLPAIDSVTNSDIL